jgi:hypothetical protein
MLRRGYFLRHKQKSRVRSGIIFLRRMISSGLTSCLVRNPSFLTHRLTDSTFSAATNTPSTTFLQEKQSTSQIFQTVASLKQQGTRHPPIRRTVWVLSQLRDFVKPAYQWCGPFTDSTRLGSGWSSILCAAFAYLERVLSSLEMDLRGRDDECERTDDK